MLYNLIISDEADKKFQKLKNRNKKQLEIIHNKIKQITDKPYHFKPLRGDMHGTRRVHIDSSFVLTYEIDETKKIITLLDYDHHDDIY